MQPLLNALLCHTALPVKLLGVFSILFQNNTEQQKRGMLVKIGLISVGDERCLTCLAQNLNWEIFEKLNIIGSEVKFCFVFTEVLIAKQGLWLLCLASSAE